MQHPTAPPRLAIVMPDTLAAMGLRQLLQVAVPVADCDILEPDALSDGEEATRYVHYFVAPSVFLSHRSFFAQRSHKTIVVRGANEGAATLPPGINSLLTSGSEHDLVRQLLSLLHRGHPHGDHLPAQQEDTTSSNGQLLSGREAEVLALVAKGLLNKQIADRLHIGIATVITHRRNIVEKLGLRTVPALTIYAVMHGYVDINDI